MSDNVLPDLAEVTRKIQASRQPLETLDDLALMLDAGMLLADEKLRAVEMATRHFSNDVDEVVRTIVNPTG